MTCAVAVAIATTAPVASSSVASRTAEDAPVPFTNWGGRCGESAGLTISGTAVVAGTTTCRAVVVPVKPRYPRGSAEHSSAHGAAASCGVAACSNSRAADATLIRSPIVPRFPSRTSRAASPDERSAFPPVPSVPPPSVPGMPLDLTTRQEFLAEPHVAALSVERPGRGPLTVPIWYGYEPGGQPWILTGAGSVKAELIRKAGRFTLMVERVTPTVRYVAVEGPVGRIVPGTREDLVTLSRRYLPAEQVDDYVRFAEADHGEQVVVTLRPESWLSADIG